MQTERSEVPAEVFRGGANESQVDEGLSVEDAVQLYRRRHAKLNLTRKQWRFLSAIELQQIILDCLSIFGDAACPDGEINKFVDAAVSEISWRRSTSSQVGRRAVGVVNNKT